MKIGQHGKFELHLTDSGVWSNPTISLIINSDGRLIPAFINDNVAEYAWGATNTQIVNKWPSISPRHLSHHIRDLGADKVTEMIATERLQFDSMSNPPNLEDEAYHPGKGKMGYQASWVGDDWVCINFIREGIYVSTVEIQKDTMLLLGDGYHVNTEEFIKEHGMVSFSQGTSRGMSG